MFGAARENTLFRKEGKAKLEHWQKKKNKIKLVLTWFRLNAAVLPLSKCVFTRQGIKSVNL